MITLLILLFPYIALFDYANEFKYMVRSFFKAPIALAQPKEIKDVAINHGQIVHVVTHDDCWNAPLPAATDNEFYYIRPVLRGATIEEGFKASERK